VHNSNPGNGQVINLSNGIPLNGSPIYLPQMPGTTLFNGLFMYQFTAGVNCLNCLHSLVQPRNTIKVSHRKLGALLFDEALALFSLI